MDNTKTLAAELEKLSDIQKAQALGYARGLADAARLAALRSQQAEKAGPAA